jgi:hypothetical protein
LRFSAAIPGTIDTPQNGTAIPEVDSSTWVDLASITFAILFLVSAQVAAITGGVLPLYGRS